MLSNAITERKTQGAFKLAQKQAKLLSETMVTFDYDSFDFFDSNREPDHWWTIVNSIEKINLTHYRPLLVIEKNKRLFVTDGQNRLLACKHLGLPIYYQIAKGNDIKKNAEEAMILLNVGLRNWTSVNYLHSYIINGKEVYIEIKKIFEDLNNFSLAQLISFIVKQSKSYDENGKVCRVSQMDMFKEGRAVLNDRAIVFAYKTDRIIGAIVDINPKLKKGNGLLHAIKRILSNTPVTESNLISRIKIHGEAVFTVSVDTDQWLDRLEKVMNFGRSKNLAVFSILKEQYYGRSVDILKTKEKVEE